MTEERTPKTDDMIRFDKVRKELSGKTILDGVSFEIAKGETFVICGPSGVGKSVTLKHMVRLLTPDEGRILVGNDCINEATGAELERIRGRFGYLFQGGALLEWLTVSENVALPLREKTSMQEEEIHPRVNEVLEMVEMEKDGHKHPSEISGGMKKRVGLARAIVMNPEIVLYDEPTSGLDPVTSRNIDRLIARMSKALGVTSIVVTHDLHSALTIASRIAMFHGGSIVELSAPDDFVKSSQPEVESFLKSQFITQEGSWERKLR